MITRAARLWVGNTRHCLSCARLPWPHRCSGAGEACDRRSRCYQRRTERHERLPSPWTSSRSAARIRSRHRRPATVVPLIRGVDRRPGTGREPVVLGTGSSSGSPPPPRDHGVGAGRERQTCLPPLDRRRGTGQARRLVDGSARRAWRAALLAVSRPCARRHRRPRWWWASARAAKCWSNGCWRVSDARPARRAGHRRCPRAALGRRAGVARVLP